MRSHSQPPPREWCYMTALNDPTSRRTFLAAVNVILGESRPTRKRLSQLGARLANAAGRSKPWSGAHIYALLHGDRWPKYGIHPLLLESAVREAGIPLTHGASLITVRGRNIAEGSVVLASSRLCASPGCRQSFVPVVPTQRYCSRACARSTTRRSKEAHSPLVGGGSN